MPKDSALTFHLCETALGWVGLVLSPRGLRAATLPRASRDGALHEALALGAAAPASEAGLGDIPRRVRALAEGSGDATGIPIDWNGLSGFRRAVLEETLRIPRGQARTYGWLACQVGRARAARAVGRVMATNPLPLVIPCHRVVGADGSLRGYGGGLWMKEALLRAEGARR
ncbi:MAG TPA: methylated-DNA--[protein]-cysteine S-methyltransferase [Dehalococcoidia bacterium]|nr:methylated-DNA--[protein]-cysteine S-methyltransferase [Dehalococcoidia bacterium]